MFNKSVHSRVVIALALGMLLTCLSTPGPAGAAQGISALTVSNVRESAFVISWVTDIATTANSVTWGISTPSTTVSDLIASSSTIHYVEVSGLNYNTTYKFKVNSGPYEDTNGGSYYQVTTGTSVSSSPGTTIYGTVFQSNGSTVVPNAIVYLQLSDANNAGSPGSSQLVSVRADSIGNWDYNLGNIRTSNFQAYFIFSPGDTLRIIGQGGSAGSVGFTTPWTITIPATEDIPQDIILTQGPTAANLNYFRSWKTDAGVQLAWETISEATTAGFNLYRREIAGDFVQINDTLIPPQNAGQPEGSAYTYLDTTADPGLRYEYRLDIIEPGLSVIEDALLTYWPFSVSLPLVLR